MTLEELYKRGQEFAKLAFDQQGHLVPMWIYETADGRHVPMSIPLHKMKDKEALAAFLTHKFREEKVVRYVSLLESWVVKRKTKEDMQEVLDDLESGIMKVSEHPDREEIIYILAEDKFHAMCGMYEIKRDTKGNPSLSEFKDDGKIDAHEGLFCHLLDGGTSIQ